MLLVNGYPVNLRKQIGTSRYNELGGHYAYEIENKMAR